MPFGEYFDDPSPPLIQSDLLGSVEKGYSREQSPIEGEGMGTSASAGPTVVTLDDQAPAGMSSRIPEADMGVEDEVEAELEVSRVSAVTSSITRKRGRPSLSGSATPAKLTTLKTPRSTKSVATVKSAGRSTGRKRTAAAIEAEPETTPEPKAESESEPEAEPARKRGRPARTVGAAASARLAAKAAKKPTRGRPKSSTSAEKPAKAGRPRKDAVNGEVPQGEYEVEAIVDSVVDADTMEHYYCVKWKGYPDSDNTWEPKKNLKHALELVRQFDAKKKSQTKNAAKEASAKNDSKEEGDEQKRSTTRKQPNAVKPVKKGKGPGRPRKRRGRA